MLLAMMSAVFFGMIVCRGALSAPLSEKINETELGRRKIDSAKKNFVAC